MGYRHSRDDLLDAAVAVVLEDGLARLTFGRVATRLGISDRMVVYYFPTKGDLVGAAVARLAADLVEVLETAFGREPRPADALLRRAWPALTTPAADRVFPVYFELVGLAASGRDPYPALATGLLDQWVDWLVPRVDHADAAERHAIALSILAQVDGLLLLRHVHGPQAAARAAAVLGIG